MANPDGVDIAQIMAPQWKANAVGTDLNRNFPVGFGNGCSSVIPAAGGFPGLVPLDQPESAALAAYSAGGFCAFINYHSSGNIIYYGAAGNSPDNAVRSQMLAGIASGCTGYRTVYDTINGTAYGSFADYVQTSFNRPSITIEIGGSSPVPISQLEGIFQRNKDTWCYVALAALTGQF